MTNQNQYPQPAEQQILFDAPVQRDAQAAAEHIRDHAHPDPTESIRKREEDIIRLRDEDLRREQTGFGVDLDPQDDYVVGAIAKPRARRFFELPDPSKPNADPVINVPKVRSALRRELSPEEHARQHAAAQAAIAATREVIDRNRDS